MDRAIIFDLNGTMIDDMYHHAKAWNELLIKGLKVVFKWDTIIENMYGKNNEVLRRLFGVDFLTINEMNTISENMERIYQQLYKPLLKPFEGLVLFLAEAQKNGIKMGIGSAGIPEDIDL